MAKVCRAKQPQGKEESRTQWVGRSPTPDDDLPLYSVKSHCTKPITVDVEMNGIKVCMEVDTGAAVSLMTQEVKGKLFPEATLQQSTTQLRTYTGEPIEVVGELPVTATYGNQSNNLTLYIVPGKRPMLLGREWLQNIKLDWKAIATVTKDPLQHMLDKHSGLFEDTLGTIKDYVAVL